MSLSASQSKQEKTALLVCPLADPVIEAPTGTYDLCVAVDGGALWFQARGEIPNLAVGDFDSTPSATLTWLHQHGVELLRVPAEKDYSDLDLALDQCEQRSLTTITLLGALGARLDHQLAVLGALLRHPQLEVTLSSKGQTVQLLKAGQSIHIARQGATFSLMAVSGGSTSATVDVSITGAQWPLDHASLDVFSSRGLSNVVSASSAEIEVHNGSIFLIVNE